MQFRDFRAVLPTQNAVIFILSTVPSVTLDRNEATVAIDATLKLNATTYPAGETVTWSSDDTDVATVSSGTVTAKAEGTATITASITVNSVTYTDTCEITVPAAAES